MTVYIRHFFISLIFSLHVTSAVGENGTKLEDNLNKSSLISAFTNNSTSDPAPIWPIQLEAKEVFLAVLLALCCLFVILGNTLVIVAVVREPSLRVTFTNYFIVSLAAADMCVGALVMIPGATVVFLNDRWPFGALWCDLWHSFDVLGSTASILNLCVISLDRYWAISDPFSYPDRMCERTAYTLIAMVWVCSGLISFPAIAWWRAVATDTSIADSGQQDSPSCVFTDNLGYLAFSSLISFYGPLVVMLTLYFRIYRTATEQMRCMALGSKYISGNSMSSSRPGEDRADQDGFVLRIHCGGQFSSNSSRTAGREQSAAGSRRPTATRSQTKSFSISRKIAKFTHERKAAKTLGIVMGVFIICWLPFFVLNLLSGVCLDCIANAHLLLTIFTWLGWLNSAMNPVIYVCWSREFRRAFVRILCSFNRESRRRQAWHATTIGRHSQTTTQV